MESAEYQVASASGIAQAPARPGAGARAARPARRGRAGGLGWIGRHTLPRGRRYAARGQAAMSLPGNDLALARPRCGTDEHRARGVLPASVAGCFRDVWTRNLRHRTPTLTYPLPPILCSLASHPPEDAMRDLTLYHRRHELRPLPQRGQSSARSGCLASRSNRSASGGQTCATTSAPWTPRPSKPRSAEAGYRATGAHDHGADRRHAARPRGHRVGQLVLLHRRSRDRRDGDVERGGAQRVRIEVKGGYTPAVVRVRAGRPSASISTATRPIPVPRRSSFRPSEFARSCRPIGRRR